MNSAFSLRVAALLFVYVGMWLYLTPYDGLNHDAQGYAAQSIAAVTPEPLGGDIFLAYRSQDEFTIFSDVYGRWIELVGLDAAAASMTFLFQLLWYLTAYLLLRCMYDAHRAIQGIGVLLVVPCVYGGLRVFNLAEPFFTARLPAEFLAFAGLWAWLSERRVLATVLFAIGALVHPLMMFPAILLVLLSMAASRWEWRGPALITLAGFVLAIGGSYALGGDAPTMEGRWLAVTQMRSRFLFLDRWNTIDWNYTAQALLTVFVGAIVLRQSRAERWMQASFWLSVGGLALAAFYTLVAPLDVLIQGQPWRWTWPARFLAVASLPAILGALWTREAPDRAAALFLAAGWLFVVPLTSQSAAVTLTSALLIAISLGLLVTRERLNSSAARLSLRSAWLVLAVVIVASAITASLAWHMASASRLSGGGVFGHVANVLRVITPAIAVVSIAAIVCLNFWTPIRGAFVLALGLLLIGTAAPTAIQAWAARPYTGTDHAAFADWRRLIPKNAEVLWWEQLRETWFLLERRAYLTRSQSGGVVFSAELADEIVRRALVLEPLIAPDFWLGVQGRVDTSPSELTVERLEAVCRDPELGFVIWGTDLGLDAPRKTWPTAGKMIYLYDCNKVRGEVVGGG